MKNSLRRKRAVIDPPEISDGVLTIQGESYYEPELRAPTVTPRPGHTHDEARLTILQKTNLFRLQRHFARMNNGPQFPTHGQRIAMPQPKVWGLDNIQDAVHIARRHGLVDADTLRRAGYNTENPRP